MNRRRFMALGVAAAASPAIAYAQTTTAPGGCAIGFVNGLLQYGADCPPLTPPGTGLAIAPPSHLAPAAVDEAAADAAAQDAETEAQERLTERRNRKDEKKNRRRDGRRDKRTRTTTRQQDQKERRRERRDIEGCEDFDSYEEAQEFYDSVKYDRVNDPLDLDRDGDGKACKEQPATPTPTTTTSARRTERSDPLDG